MVSDLLYICKAPFYSTWVFVLCIIFFCVPFTVNIIIACGKVNNFCNKCNYCFLLSLNLINIRSKLQRDADRDYAINKLVFVAGEDFP